MGWYADIPSVAKYMDWLVSKVLNLNLNRSRSIPGPTNTNVESSKDPCLLSYCTVEEGPLRSVSGRPVPRLKEECVGMLPTIIHSFQ